MARVASQGAVESLWSIDQYFEFVLVLLFSTGLAFQVGACGCEVRDTVLALGTNGRPLEPVILWDS